MSDPKKVRICVALGSHSKVVPGKGASNFGNELGELLRQSPFVTILFIDHETICLDYLGLDSPWQESYADIIAVDEKTSETLLVDIVPQWRWYASGAELFRLTGDVDEVSVKKADAALREMYGQFIWGDS